MKWLNQIEAEKIKLFFRFLICYFVFFNVLATAKKKRAINDSRWCSIAYSIFLHLSSTFRKVNPSSLEQLAAYLVVCLLLSVFSTVFFCYLVHIYIYIIRWLFILLAYPTTTRCFTFILISKHTLAHTWQFSTLFNAHRKILIICTVCVCMAEPSV